MTQSISRRSFIRHSTSAALGLGLLGNRALANHCCPEHRLPFKISLAQWSIHRALRSGQVDPLDFPRLAKEEFGISAVEYVNQFYMEKATDKDYFQELKKRADDNGVKSLIIMVDGEGNLGEAGEDDRKRVVKNHYKWVDLAAFLGCHSIRVNAGGPGGRKTLAAAVVDGLGRLSEYAAEAGLNVIVENHGGFSSDGAWLSGVISQVGMDNCGTLPDFGNFCIRRGKDADGKRICLEEYDRYKGVAELMPFARAVSAKSHDFDAGGNEIHTDYSRMMKIVLDAGYRGYIGVEYEGSRDDEFIGIHKTKALLERVGKNFST
jgi:sugar phosphate isomerase/epimerase